MKGFIVNRDVPLSEPDPATGFPLLITGPVNTNKGKINGFEAQVRTFFDLRLPAELAAGVRRRSQRHATSMRKRDFNILADPARPIRGLHRGAADPDVSKWTYNLIGMYERGPLSVRLSYNWRGHIRKAGSPNNGDFTLQGHAHPSPRLDLSTSYATSTTISRSSSTGPTFSASRSSRTSCA